jgi:hypothetical protein
MTEQRGYKAAETKEGNLLSVASTVPADYKIMVGVDFTMAVQHTRQLIPSWALSLNEPGSDLTLWV